MQFPKMLVAIGGGEIKQKTTLVIDRFIVEKARERITDGHRPIALMFPTASHDCMPYFNSFRKTYTSVLDVKADVALLSREGLMNADAIRQKLAVSDIIYVGGGDTKYMLEVWQRWDILKDILAAYERGAILCGLSAGAICWFEQMYTDFDILPGQSPDYKLLKGLGVLAGTACPHYDLRCADFDLAAEQNAIPLAYALEADAALVFVDGEPQQVVSAGGSVYRVCFDGTLKKEELRL
ncbi:MAG: Type 1 glutamine amidotransferase-like domain-containing protein [Clostridia bacterium]|nr:Type 1 glutamine amidotransferase-like domain-containing protein [Clostridia bacterium]